MSLNDSTSKTARMLLKIHPYSQIGAGVQIEATVTRGRSRSLVLSYVVTGALSELLIPEPTEPTRADELWRHTCFEAFVRASGPEYYEFNFAPTTQWAAYRFNGYRNDRSWAAIPPPVTKVRSAFNRYSLQTTLSLESLYRPDQALWHFGLSAVIEDRSGRMSYWALAHPAGKPDFHRPESFVYEFSPLVQP